MMSFSLSPHRYYFFFFFFAFMDNQPATIVGFSFPKQSLPHGHTARRFANSTLDRRRCWRLNEHVLLSDLQQPTNPPGEVKAMCIGSEQEEIRGRLCRSCEKNNTTTTLQPLAPQVNHLILIHVAHLVCEKEEIPEILTNTWEVVQEADDEEFTNTIKVFRKIQINRSPTQEMVCPMPMIVYPWDQRQETQWSLKMDAAAE